MYKKCSEIVNNHKYFPSYQRISVKIGKNIEET